MRRHRSDGAGCARRRPRCSEHAAPPSRGAERRRRRRTEAQRGGKRERERGRGRGERRALSLQKQSRGRRRLSGVSVSVYVGGRGSGEKRAGACAKRRVAKLRNVSQAPRPDGGKMHCVILGNCVGGRWGARPTSAAKRRQELNTTALGATRGGGAEAATSSCEDVRRQDIPRGPNLASPMQNPYDASLRLTSPFEPMAPQALHLRAAVAVSHLPSSPWQSIC